jgi:citrate synthase
MMLYQMLGKPQHQELLSALEAAHFRAALSNDNTSSRVALATYISSGDIGKAVAAACLVQGGLHAPITQARALLDAEFPVGALQEILRRDERVPGFGNSFYKDRIDPAYQPVFDLLPARIAGDIYVLRNHLLADIHPNAAIITAAVAKVVGLPAGIEPAIFIYCRTPAWVQLCMKAKSPKVGTVS